MRRGKGGAAKVAGSPAVVSEEDAVNPYENSIKTISTIKTVEEFWDTYNFLVRPNELPTTTDYHFFREGVKPTWEDANNAKGGKWIVRLRKGLASRYWEEAILALIGGQYPGVQDGEICGVVLSVRYSEDILGIWNRTANDREVTERLRDAIKKILQLPPHAHIEYKPHQTSLQDKSSFRNTQVWKPKNVDRSQPHGGASGSGEERSNTTRRAGSWTEREERTGGGPKSAKDRTERSWR
jgi:translation initiation factor 4E